MQNAEVGVVPLKPVARPWYSKSGRGLHALQDASRLIGTQDSPAGFGVRAVLCRFSHSSLPLPER